MNRKYQVKQTKVKQKDAPASERLSLTDVKINLGKDADVRLGEPDKVNIFVDQKSKIIRLVPSNIGKKIVRARDGHSYIACKLSKMMPCEIYLMNKNKDFVYIPEYQEL